MESQGSLESLQVSKPLDAGELFRLIGALYYDNIQLKREVFNLRAKLKELETEKES